MLLHACPLLEIDCFRSAEYTGQHIELLSQNYGQFMFVSLKRHGLQPQKLFQNQRGVFVKQ